MPAVIPPNQLASGGLILSLSLSRQPHTITNTRRNLAASRQTLSRIAATISLAGLLILAYLAICPQLPDIARAAPANPLKTTSAPSLSISANKTALNLHLSPDHFDSDNFTVTTTTDNTTGYTTTISTNSPTETCLIRPSDVTNGKTCSTPNIPAIKPATGSISPAGVITPSTLTPNQWAASLSTSFSANPNNDAAWFGIPSNTSPSIVKSSLTATSTTGESTTITIGATANATLPATATGDGYAGSILITTTANAIAPATVTGVKTDNAGNNIGNNSGNNATAGLNGGDTMTITGTNLDSTYEITINNIAIPAANCNIDSNTQLTCTTPAKAAGAYDVIVKTWGSQSGVTATTKITYVVSPTPSITAPTASQIFDAGTTGTALKATTNIYATCYYGTATNPTTQMATTNASGTDAHQQSITGLNNASTYTRYIRCQYPNSPVSSTFSVTFYVRTATPAVPTTLTPASGATVNLGATAVTVVSSTATCKWGTSSTTVTNSSGTGSYTVVSGSNTLYYSCVAGSGNTESAARTGSWIFTGDNIITGLTPAKCAAMTPFTGSNKSAVIGMLDDTDSTATKYYAVAKLADNRCWMISNYAKPYGTFITNIASNWNSTENATNTAYYTSPSNTGVTPIRNTRACTGNGYASTAADAIASLDDSGKTAASSIHNCGYLYNWYGATAGTGTSTSDYEVVTGSICPTGWHLPTTDNVGTIPNAWGTDKQEFMTLWANLNSDYDKVVGSSSAFRGVRSGNVANDAYLETQGEDGLYWSSVARSTTNAYSFSFNGGSGVFPRDSHRKYLGFSVRCILNAN